MILAAVDTIPLMMVVSILPVDVASELLIILAVLVTPLTIVEIELVEERRELVVLDASIVAEETCSIDPLGPYTSISDDGVPVLTLDSDNVVAVALPRFALFALRLVDVEFIVFRLVLVVVVAVILSANRFVKVPVIAVNMDANQLVEVPFVVTILVVVALLNIGLSVKV